MAMQPGAAIVPDKNPWYSHQPQQLDEREGFLMWLRGEFAAANAIIDSLCHHLQAVGAPGEYDGVVGSIQQRRCNWNGVLHMQQYFSVAEVIYALQQAGLRRQQKMIGFDGGARKEYRRGGRGQVNGKDLKVYVKSGENVDVNGNGNGAGEEKKELVAKSEVASPTKSQENTQVLSAHVEDKSEGTGEGSNSEDEPGVVQKLQEKLNLKISPKTFVATEIYDGKLVNVVDGMKLYDELLDESQVSNVNTLVKSLRNAGRRGLLQGQTFVISKRPCKGHGRETIRLGVPIADTPLGDESASWTSKDLKTEPIPSLLNDVIEHLLSLQVFTEKPDSCFIDIFNEGDYSQPHVWPQGFGRPISILFLTECDMSFGKVIAGDHPGDYCGALKLSLSPGSLLVLQGKSTDFARHALPSLNQQRILITLTKSQPINKTTSPSFPSASAPPFHWVPPNTNRPISTKHFPPVPISGVLHPPLPPTNGIAPIFVPAIVAPIMHPTPRVPVPAGTGVFLPPHTTSNQPVYYNKDCDEKIEGAVTTEEEAKSTGAIEVVKEEVESEG